MPSNSAQLTVRSPVELPGPGYCTDVPTALPSARTGTGCLIEGLEGAVIRGWRIGGFHQNLVLRNCRRVRIEGCDLSRSHASEILSRESYDERDWLDIFDEATWRTYGAGIILEGCEECTVVDCVASGAQNGIWLVGSRGCRVLSSDFSHNSGWGIWMWSSSDNLISQNNCDWCVRCEDPGRFSAGGDSAGIMLSNGNHRNSFTHNSLRFSGDGFFLNGLRVEPSEHNLIAFNDAGHSPHNAFESSWSGHNRFVGNIASNSRYGFWCGYSRHNEITGNIIEDCLEWGIAIEHGSANRISGNELRRNRAGIVLFRRDDVERPSEAYLIHGNVIDASEQGVVLSDTSEVDLVSNLISAPTGIEVRKGSAGISIVSSRISGAPAVAMETGCEVSAARSLFEGDTAGVIIKSETGPDAGPLLPVRARSTEPEAEQDHEFRWFDRRRGAGTLVGTAEV